jgi:SAM-dependent methyltransferase
MTLPRALYDGLLAEVYDDYTAADDRTDVQLWDRLAAENPGPVLELGCGTGRVLLPLAESGRPVEGLDASADMLARCRALAQARGLAPILHRADMVDFALNRRFGLIFCAAGTFTLLAEPGAMEAALARARAHLAPGGLLALAMDAPGPASDAAVVARDMTRESDGARLRCILDPLESECDEVQRWHMTNEVALSDGTIRRDAAEIAFRRPTPSRFAAMLRAAGFREVALRDAQGAGELHVRDSTYLALARVG